MTAHLFSPDVTALCLAAKKGGRKVASHYVPGIRPTASSPAQSTHPARHRLPRLNSTVRLVFERILKLFWCTTNTTLKKVTLHSYYFKKCYWDIKATHFCVVSMLLTCSNFVFFFFKGCQQQGAAQYFIHSLTSAHSGGGVHTRQQHRHVPGEINLGQRERQKLAFY